MRNWLVGWLSQRSLTGCHESFWLRFSEQYRRLRRARRAWLGQIGLTLAGAALLLALGREPVRANTIAVLNGEVAMIENDRCSLIEAIANANDTATGQPHNDCAAGDPAGSDVITLPVSGSFTLNGSLATYYDSPTGVPLVGSAIVIEGNGATIARDEGGEAQFRLLAVSSSGDLTLNSIHLDNGYALGTYGGGAVINAGRVTLNESSLSGNTAVVNGGALYNRGGAASINNTEFSGNTAGHAGGGLYNRGDGSVAIGGGVFGGNTAAFGGGVSTYGGMVSIESSVLSGNTATGGGGAAHAIVLGPPPVPPPATATLTIANSTLSGNTAGTYGGGVYIFSTSATIIGSTISNNTAGDNGGGADFHTDNSDVRIEESTFTGNHSSDNGGGISSVGANMVVTNSTVQGNTAAFGGGMYVGASKTAISRTTISGNSALLAGGGVRTLAGSELLMSNSTVSGNLVTSPVTFAGGFNHHSSTMTLSNSTVTGNSAAQFGGGVRNYNGTATLQRNLIAGNQATTGREVDNLNGTLNANAFNLFGFNADAGVNGFAVGAADIVPAEPLAAILNATLAGNGGPTETHALVAGSPAVDAAPNSGCSAPPVNGLDQRGLPRNADGDGEASANECDVGAFELQPAAVPTPTPTAQPTPIPGGKFYLPIVLTEG
jgi:hypothetical protein